jgi:hypothetical protein
MTIPYEDPYAYADSLLQAKGTYKFAAEIANNFQATPIREIEQQINYDPADIASQKQRITFPLGATDNYWIKYLITSPDGSIVAQRTLRAQANGSPVTKLPAAIKPDAPPAVGHMRINPTAHTNGVYKAGEPLDVTIRVFPKGAQSIKMEWELTQALYPAVIESGKKSITFSSGAYQDVTLKLAGEKNRDAYCLHLTIRDGERVVDKADYLLGRQTEISKLYTGRSGTIPDRTEVKRGSYCRITYMDPQDRTRKSEDEALAYFEQQMDDIARITRYVTYMMDLRDIEILPGVYDLALLDRVMDAAADRGCALTIRIAHVDQEGEFRWLKYSRQHNFDGLEIPENFYGGFALTDENYTNCWLGGYRTISERYKTHPGYQGLYLMQPAGEATVEDKPWEGLVAGYEIPTREEFRKYLQKDLGLTISQLNQRWGTTFKDWSEVLPPMPDFKLGKVPDLRMSWVDFCSFKDKLDKDWWFPRAAEAIRAYDKNHVLITYGGTAAPEPLTGVVDYFHNGGNHFLQMEEKLIDPWAIGKTGWITEPHHPQRWAAYGDPAEKGWVLDWSIWVMTAQAGGGGANLHIYYMPQDGGLPGHYGGAFAFDRFQRYKPILDELQTMSLVRQPAQVAVLQDPYTLFCKHRTTFAPRSEDLKRWFELVKFDGIRHEDLDEKNLAQYKLILPNVLDEVMSKHNIEMLDKLVREQGCRMIISATTGRYCPELGSEQFPLLRRLGITPPTGEYVQGEAGVTAAVSAANPLLLQSQKVAFFTLADMQKDLQSEEVRNKFWAWPYRWIPQTDYFGYFRNNKTTNGEVIARFPSGGVAISLHKVGSGEVIVFWGTPDFRPEKLKGMMAKAADWAGVKNPSAGNAIPLMLEGDSPSLNRHYVLLYHELPGTYQQKFPSVGDGDWFIDEMVSDQKLGVYTGKELRESGMPVTYGEGYSPLKIYRLMPKGSVQADWADKYRVPGNR